MEQKIKLPKSPHQPTNMSVSGDEMSTRSTLANVVEDDLIELPEGMILGENGRPAFAGTDSRCLDFFFKMVPDLPREDLLRMLPECWEEDCSTTLALIFNIGNVRGGKQDKTNFYRAMLWLWEEHPETFLLNLKQIPEHTSIKCVLDLLMYIIHKNQDSRFSLEGAILAATNHSELRAAIRSSTKQERRQARRARQAAVKQEFASACGGLEVRDLRKARPNLSKTAARVAAGACVYCGDQGHWKEHCPSSRENRPPRPRWAEEGEEEEELDLESAVYVGRAGPSQMARMLRQLSIQRNDLPKPTLPGAASAERRRSERRSASPPTTMMARGCKATTRWYGVTAWRSAGLAEEFRAFIVERDRAYAAKAKAAAKAGRAGYHRRHKPRKYPTTRHQDAQHCNLR